MRLTTHQLAQLLMTLPDMPVGVQRTTNIYQASPTEFRIAPDGKLLFDSDSPVKGEVKQEVFWFTQGPFI